MNKDEEREWVRLDGENVKLVYSGKGDKVLVKMWFEGNDREYVFEGMLRFIGFKENDDGE